METKGSEVSKRQGRVEGVGFCRELFTEPERYLDREEYILFGDQLYLLPPQMIDLAGLKVVRPGLHMGSMKKNRFEPSHALALSMKEEEAVRCFSMKADGRLSGI